MQHKKNWIIEYSAIYNWKGSGSEQEQNDPSLMDSFCHLIIAQEATTEATWIILIDQGEDTGVPTTNCIQYIISRICEGFKLKIANLRAFEVWPYLKPIIDAGVPVVFAGLPKVRTYLNRNHPDILSRLKTLILYPIVVEDFISE
ncbi:MAG: hypothetical protein PHG14_06995 [Desulfobacter postgatei]|nr:hypothetical protein [Desulfobacter postgatei]MDD4273456.1 hypothetical protein [Desulfobacter postgatei]